MPVSGLGHLRAQSMYVNNSIISRDLITRISARMPQLTTEQRFALPNLQNGQMVYDIEVDDLFVYRQGGWTSLVFSSIDPSQGLIISNETPSNNTESGAFVVYGGAGFGGDLNIGGSVDISQTVTIGDDSDSIDELSGAFVVSGGAAIGKTLNIGENLNVQQTLTLGNGTSTYSFPSEKGNDGQLLSLDGDSLVFTDIEVETIVTSEFPFTSDNRILKTVGQSIKESGLIIDDNNNLSGINELTLGSGTTSYTFPSETGSAGQTLVLSTTGSFIFVNSSVSPTLVNSSSVFTDNKLLKSDGTSRNIQESGISISDTNDVSGINILSLGSGTNSYSFPNSKGSAGQILTMSTTGSLVFESANVSTETVTSTNDFGTDNRLIRSDGTERGVQESGITISDTNDISGINELTIGSGTSSYTFPTEKGDNGQVLVISTTSGNLEFSEFSITNNVNSEFPFTQDNLLVKTKDTGITETGISINSNNDISGINILTLGSGTTSYSFPTEKGSSGQILALSTTGALVFETASISPNNVNASTVFGTDNVLIRSDGTSRNVQSTGITISNSDDMSNLNSLTITGTATSLSSTTGSLIVTGGVGIGENLNIDNNITFGGRLTGRVRDVTGDTTLDDDYILNVAPTGTSGAVITLPNIQNHIYTGVTYMIIKENSNTVTINTNNGSDFITSGGSNLTSISLTGSTDERITLVSNGKKWVTM